MLKELIQIHRTQLPICSDKSLDKVGRSLEVFYQKHDDVLALLLEFPICFCSLSLMHTVLDGPLHMQLLLCS